MRVPRSVWLSIPAPVRRLPADLAAVVVLVVATNVTVLAPVVRETPLRIVFGLGFVLFLPGYAFIAALFPEAGESPTADEGDADSAAAEAGDDATDEDSAGSADAAWPTPGLGRSGIDGIERVALSFGLSIAISPLIGLVLNFTPWGIRLVPIVASVSGFTLLATVIAAVRRWELPPDERFRVPYREWYRAGHDEVFHPATRTDAILNVALAASILLAVGAVSYAIVVPPQGEQFSAIYVLTEDDDGELVADDYPTELVAGDSSEIVVGVDNHEHERTDYAVLVLEQRVSIVENGTTSGGTGSVNASGNETVTYETIVEDQRELDRFTTTLDHNQSWHHAHNVSPTFTGENVRVVWLLFPGGDVPAEPSMDDTEYSNHLWIDVREPGGE
ncbi:DUF1616 domain-containing protein [Halovivax limisalsi]|uniref:DUF1616 domain-containing protein n=1 Tax=Halovivax limisalsi TaxID=1453760 RepID=UPI001FFDC3DF|nr:DUF1616 domain-containing protein [Halovivax limisalsi]